MNDQCMNTTEADQYQQLQRQLQENIENLAEYRLFTTNATGLFEMLIEGLPADMKQQYTCNACRRFIDTYGGLVVISTEGLIKPALWTPGNAPAFFRDSVHSIHREVISAKVTGVFFDSNDTWGTPQTGEWTHFHVKPHDQHIHSTFVKTANQTRAEKREDFKTLINAMKEFDAETVSQALSVLEQEALYRSDRIIGPCKWLKELHDQIATPQHKNARTNLLWRAVGYAPSGFCHIKSSVIGSLLEDIKAGLDFKDIKARFDQKMDPKSYQRPQIDPSQANVEEAERLVETMGIAKSLDRRFARLEELQRIWSHPTEQEAKKGDSVFAGISTKDKKKTTQLEMPTARMTWMKFCKEVLPTAESLEYYTPRLATFAAILTEAHENSPPILQWDQEEMRNPFSWYMYHRGSIPRQWGLEQNVFVKVNAICLQPSMWFVDNYERFGASVFFILDGAKDQNYKEAGNALFPETLRSELRPVRATIEAFSRKEKLWGFDDATACGLCFQKGSENVSEFRVKSGTLTTVYEIDRWD